MRRIKTPLNFTQYNLNFKREPFIIKTWYDTYRVNPGVLDHEARGAFTTGQCHALALAINKRTGWQLYGLFSNNGWGEPVKGTPAHVVVKDDKGNIIDVAGIGADARWGNYILAPQTVKDVLRYEEIDYRRPRIDDAELFVDAVLDLVYEQKSRNASVPRYR